MKIKRYETLSNNGKLFRLYFSPSWVAKRKHKFVITAGNTRLELGGKEAKQLHAFLNKVF